MPDAPTPLGPLQQPEGFPLAFRLRQPPPAAPRACLLLLHGVGSNEADLTALAATIDPEVLVVFVRGPLVLGPQQFAWFRVAFTASGPSIVEAEAEAARQTLIRFVGQVQAAYGIAPRHTLIAGFSQGGIMSASVGLSAPAQVGGFALLSGRILPELAPHVAPREQLGSLHAFIGHGEFDSKLPVGWAQRADRLLTELGVIHATRFYPIDHGISGEMAEDFRAWVAERTAAS